jgi:hypothetical protein
MKTIPIGEATDGELSQFATDVLALDISGTAGRADLLAAIGQAWNLPHISVPVDEGEGGEDAARVPLETLTTGRDDGPLVMLKILPTDMPGGKHPAVVELVGGTGPKVIQRNMLVGIPYAYYLILQNAKPGVVDQGPEQNGRPGDLITTTVTNYPLSEVQLPPQHEIEAWHERTKNRLLAA